MNTTPTRRAVLAWLAAAPAIAFVGRRSLAQAKATKAAMKYQDKPNAGNECDKCLQYVPGKSAKAPGTCKVVEGSVSPKGWCAAFAPKPKA
jgi:hypothetical protein